MMNKIILIDDDVKFKDAFQLKAQTQPVPLRLIYRNSFEGLKEVLPKNIREASCVVLDIKCLMTSNQAKEDEGFISAAITYLDQHCPQFPRIVLTGDDESFSTLSRFYRSEDIFQKTPDGLDKTFEKLNFYVENSKDIQIRRDHPTVFSLFDDGLYSAHDSATLLNVLSNLEITEFSKFGGILRDIRALQESIYKTINIKNKNVVPDAMFKGNGMIDFNKLMKHLNGNPLTIGGASTSIEYQNSAVYQLSNSLYWASGNYIHANPNQKYIISNYTLKALTNSLLELFLWSKVYLK